MFADGLFYTLSRRWGKTATLRHKVASTTNPATGVQKVTYDEWTIKRCILMTIDNFKEVKAQLGADYGGLFDQNTRLIIITKRELPKEKTVEINDLLIIQDETWRVAKRVILPETSAYAAKVERITDAR